MLVLTALTLMTLDLHGGETGPVAGLRRAALGAFAPVQHGVAVLVRPLSAAGRWVDDQRRLHAEVARLRARSAGLDAVSAQRDELRAENTELRSLLALRERLGLRTVGARVLGTAPGDPGTTVLIDAGSDAGLAADMTVVDDRAVVGRVVAVSAEHAQVELVTSPRARFAVRVVEGRHTGRLRGRGDGGVQLELDDPHAEVPAGARLVTRAFEGSAVPDGLPVATVAGARGDRYRVAHPAAALGALDLVQVVLTAPQPSALASTRPSPAPLPPPPRPSER